MLRKTTIVLICTAGMLLLSTCQNQPPEFEPTWESLEGYTCPEWFRDAKLGIFLHWGPASVPAVDGWYGRNMYVQGHRGLRVSCQNLRPSFQVWIQGHYESLESGKL